MPMVNVRVPTVLSHWCYSVGSCWLLFSNMNILSSTSKRYLSHTQIYLVINIKILLHGHGVQDISDWGTANCLWPRFCFTLRLHFILKIVDNFDYGVASGGQTPLSVVKKLPSQLSNTTFGWYTTPHSVQHLVVRDIPDVRCRIAFWLANAPRNF